MRQIKISTWIPWCEGHPEGVAFVVKRKNLNAINNNECISTFYNANNN